MTKNFTLIRTRAELVKALEEQYYRVVKSVKDARQDNDKTCLDVVVSRVTNGTRIPRLPEDTPLWYVRLVFDRGDNLSSLIDFCYDNFANVFIR